MANQPAMQPAEQSNAAGPPQTQITAAPRFVRQAPAAAPQYFGGVAGGPMSGFGQGMGGGMVSPSYGAGAPTMTPGGFAAPTAAMSTTQLAQTYNPFSQAAVAQGMMGSYLPQFPTEDTVQQGMWDEDLDLLYNPELGGEQENVQDEEYTPIQEPEELTTGEAFKKGIKDWLTGETFAEEEPGWQEGTFEGPDGNVYFQDEDGNYVRTHLNPGESMDKTAVDDYTYGLYMQNEGVDVNDQKEYSDLAQSREEQLEMQYEEQQRSNETQIGAAARSFQEWAARSGVAFSPTAMAQHQGNLSTQFQGMRQELDNWLENARIEDQDRVIEQRQIEDDEYDRNITTAWDNYVATTSGAAGAEYGFAVAFMNYAKSHIERWKDLGISESEIISNIRRGLLQTMWEDEMGTDAYEDIENTAIGTMDDYISESDETVEYEGGGTGTAWGVDEPEASPYAHMAG